MSRFLLICLLVLPLGAQAQTGSVQGHVFDTQNRPLPGATIQIEGTLFGTSTGPEGAFLLTNIPVGEYVLVARFIGYTSERMPVRVAAGSVQRVDFKLAEDPLGLGEVVVSGTFNPATKLESSTAITTLSPRQIELRLPRGTADLLRAVPGVQVNSTYGEAGADVTVRGLPQAANSSFRYVSLQEDGLPVFEPPGLVFAFPDAMLRLDETVARVEAVRGGSAAVFASNTPGGIINVLSKTGGNELAGTLKNTVGAQGLYRQDFNVGGPLLAQWRFNVGGYYRHDEGVRNAGFPTNRGGQIKANLTRDFAGGYVRFYGKYLNEKNLWYMGIPIQNYRSPEAIPGGPSLGEGTTFSPERLVLTLPDAYNRGGFTQKPLSDGYSVRYQMIGLELAQDVGAGWNVTLRSRALSATNDMNLMADVADPFPIAAFGQPGLPAQVPRFVRFVNSGETITDASAVAGLNGNGLMSVHGLAFIAQPVSNFISDLQATRQIGAHQLNVGAYYSGYRTALRIVQAGVFLEVAHQPRMIQIMIPDQNGDPQGLTPADGFAGYNTGYWNLRSFTNLAALYAGDVWQVNDRLTVEAGLRLNFNHSTGAAERPVVPGRVDNGAVVGQVVPPGYPAFVPTPQESAAGMFGSGRYRTWNYDFTNLGGSIGANYRLSERWAAYARASRGTRTPTVQQWSFQATGGNQTTGETVRGEVEEIIQAEAGLKAAATRWSLLLTGFYGQSTNFITVLQRGQADGSFRFLPITGNTRTIGAEVEAAVRPLEGLHLQFVGTVQDPRFTRFQYAFFVPGNNPNSGPQVRDYSGNLLNDAVRLLADLTTTYSRNAVDLFANYRYTGSRMANRPNTIELPGYSEVTAGASYAFHRLRVALQATNLFNTQAIALMASRTGEDVLRVHADGTAESVVTSGAAAGTTAQSYYTTGQGILPRTVLLSVTYDF